MLDKLRSRVLMKDGEWIVPENERPKGWAQLGFREPARVTIPPIPQPTQEQVAGVVGDLAAQCRPTAPKPHKTDQAILWRQIDAAIRRSAQRAGTDERLLFAARVLIAGMWTRDRWKLCRMLMGERLGSVAEISRISKRLERTGIWRNDGLICIGSLTRRRGYDLQLWLSAMVGAGQIEGRYDEKAKEMFFWADGTLPKPLQSTAGRQIVQPMKNGVL